ncbi:MAG: hypothetical protein GX567_08470, partial [Clostridia bacterium]|nr:hypothetical protein [Clostridia bacterium]
MNYAESELQSEILDLYLPVLVSGAFDHEQTSKSASEVLISYLISRTPSLKYDQDVMNLETPTEDGSVYDAIHQNKLIMDELSSDLLLKENQTQKEQSIEYASDQSPLKISDNQISNNQINDHQTMGQFSPATPQISYSLEDLSDFTYLLSHFYTVDKTTSISQDVLSARKMLSKNYSIQREASSDAPQILIYHTHSLEAYADSNPNDISTGVVGVGAYLSALLKERGYQVLHHTKSYDKVSHDQAYSLAAPALEALLKEYPSIEIIIDIHRDGVANDRHLVTEINDKPTAQIMLFNGLSSTVAHGPIE